MKTPRQIRDDAADLLESRLNAWGQGDYRGLNADGTYWYCVIGACREAAGYFDARAAANAAWAVAGLDLAGAEAADRAEDAANAAADAAEDAARAAAIVAADTRFATPISWNDAPGRTREEVIAALRAK